MDNFFVRMFGGNGRKERQAGNGVPASTVDKEVGVSGSFAANINYLNGPQAALTASAVHRAVELRAKTEAQFQAQYQKMDAAGGNYTADMRGVGRTINYLLQVSPNPLMSAATFWEQLVINRLMLGNGMAYIERDEFGDPVHLWSATLGGYNPITNTYILTYPTDRGIVNRVEVAAKDVIHWANTYRDFDGYLGIPTLRYAFDTLALIATEKQQALEVAAKGGRMKLIIGEDTSKVQSPICAGLFDKKEMDKYAMELQQRLYQNDVVAMRGLDKVQPISMSAQDQQMIELLNMTQDDVARFYGTPRPLLMLDTNSHYTTPTNATLEYMTRTIQPDILEIEQELTRKLLKMEDFGKRRIHMCEQPLLRLDKEAQAKVDEINLRTGAKTVNEIRAQYDLPAVADGDVVYVSTNLARLGSEKLEAAAGGGGERESGKAAADAAGTVAEDEGAGKETALESAGTTAQGEKEGAGVGKREKEGGKQ